MKAINNSSEAYFHSKQASQSLCNLFAHFLSKSMPQRWNSLFILGRWRTADSDFRQSVHFNFFFFYQCNFLNSTHLPNFMLVKQICKNDKIEYDKTIGFSQEFLLNMKKSDQMFANRLTISMNKLKDMNQWKQWPARFGLFNIGAEQFFLGHMVGAILVSKSVYRYKYVDYSDLVWVFVLQACSDAWGEGISLCWLSESIAE